MALFGSTLWDSGLWSGSVWAPGVWDDDTGPALVLLSDGELGPGVALTRTTAANYWGI